MAGSVHSWGGSEASCVQRISRSISPIHALLPCPSTPFRSKISYFVNKPSWSKAPESKEHPGMTQLLHVGGGGGIGRWLGEWFVGHGK